MSVMVTMIWGLVKPMLLKLATAYMVEEIFIQLGEELVSRTDSKADDKLLEAAKKTLGREARCEDQPN